LADLELMTALVRLPEVVPGRLQIRCAYAVVAYFSDCGGATNSVVIEGATVAGTEAASDFVLNDKAIAPILRRAILPDGSLADFQVLLETRNLAGSAPRAQIVATRFSR
jgi:hypothetical protein